CGSPRAVARAHGRHGRTRAHPQPGQLHGRGRLGGRSLRSHPHWGAVTKVPFIPRAACLQWRPAFTKGPVMNTSTMFRTLSVMALSAGLTLAHAADPSTVLKGRAVTEGNLVDALTPEEPIVTRSLRVQRDTPGQQAARKPSASLLITFETNSAELTPGAKKQLDVVAAALKNNKLADYAFNVEGHADPRGTHD